MVIPKINSRFLISREIRKGDFQRKAVENERGSKNPDQLVNEIVYIVEDAADKDMFAVEEEDVFGYTSQQENNNNDFANKSGDHSLVGLLAKPPLNTSFDRDLLGHSISESNKIYSRDKENSDSKRRTLVNIHNKLKLVHPDVIKQYCGKLIPKGQIHPALQREYLSDQARKSHVYIFFKPSDDDEEVDILGLSDGDSDERMEEELERMETDVETNEFLDQIDQLSAQETENRPSNVTPTVGLDSDEDSLFIDENPVKRKLEMDKSIDKEQTSDFKISYSNQNESTGGKECSSSSDDDVTFVSETKSPVKPTSPIKSMDQKKSPYTLHTKSVLIGGSVRKVVSVKNSAGQTIGRVLHNSGVNARGNSVRSSAVSRKSNEKSITQTDSMQDGPQPKKTFINLAGLSGNVHNPSSTAQTGSRLSGAKTISINRAAVPCSISDETHIKAKPQLSSSPENGRNTTPVLKLTQPFKCPHCTAAFSKMDALQAHKERDHRLINTLPNQSTHVSPNVPSIKLDNGKTVIRLESPFAQPELRTNEAPTVGSLGKRPSDPLAEPSQAFPQVSSAASKPRFSVIPRDTSPGSVRSKGFVTLPELRRSGVKILRPKLPRQGLRVLKPKPPTLEEFVQNKGISVQNSTDPSSSSQHKIIKITPKGGGPPLKVLVPSDGKFMKAPVGLIGKKYIISNPSAFQSNNSGTFSEINDILQLLTSRAPDCLTCKSAISDVVKFKRHAIMHSDTDDRCLHCITIKKFLRKLRFHMQNHIITAS